MLSSGDTKTSSVVVTVKHDIVKWSIIHPERCSVCAQRGSVWILQLCLQKWTLGSSLAELCCSAVSGSVDEERMQVLQLITTALKWTLSFLVNNYTAVMFYGVILGCKFKHIPAQMCLFVVCVCSWGADAGTGQRWYVVFLQDRAFSFYFKKVT